MKLLGQPVSPSNEMLSWSTYEQPFTLVTLSCRSVGLCANLSVVLCCTLTSRQLLVPNYGGISHPSGWWRQT